MSQYVLHLNKTPIVAGYHANAVNWNGSTYLSPSDIHTSMSASKVGVFSGWFKRADDTHDLYVIIDDAGGNIYLEASGRVRADLNATGGGLAVQTFTNTGVLTAASGWTHILYSWDTAASRIQLWINGADASPAFATTNNFTIPWASSTATTPVSGVVFPFYGDMADLYLNIVANLDLTSAPNVAKFISGGKPVDLGSTGSTPTGSSPVIYLSGATGAWQTNKNAGVGGFTVGAGTITTASTSPSD